MHALVISHMWVTSVLEGKFVGVTLQMWVRLPGGVRLELKEFISNCLTDPKRWRHVVWIPFPGPSPCREDGGLRRHALYLSALHSSTSVSEAVIEPLLCSPKFCV